MRRLIGSVVAAAAVVLVCVPAAACSGPAPHSAFGTFSVDQMCQAEYGSSASAYTKVNTNGKGPSGWYCQTPRGIVPVYPAEMQKWGCDKQAPGTLLLNNWDPNRPEWNNAGWHCLPRDRQYTVGSGHEPGRLDVSTLQVGKRFYAVPNFEYFLHCGRPCVEYLFAQPTEQNAELKVTAEWPCEGFMPSAGTHCLMPPAKRTAAQTWYVPYRYSGDRVLVVCQTRGGQRIQNEQLQRSTIWDAIATPVSKLISPELVRTLHLKPVPGMPGYYLAWGSDMWLGNTGWHGIPCTSQMGTAGRQARPAPSPLLDSRPGASVSVIIGLMGPEYSPPPGSTAQPGAGARSIGAASSGGQVNQWTSNEKSPRPMINLVNPQGPGAMELARELAAQAAAKAGAANAAAAPAAAAGTQVARPKRGRVVIVAVLALLVLAGGGAAAIVFVLKRPAQVAVHTPTPTPSPTPLPTPSPTPSPAPSPTPSATPAAQTITAPAQTPTADHPQAVTITDNSGLWLRSSPTSVNRSNIIGWMPKDAQVSVDSTGDFWWHGTYKGTAGYFASKYTQ